MSVLIKGMEKPEHCGYCRFRYDGICHALQKTQYNMNECPLVVIDDAGLNDTIDPVNHGKWIKDNSLYKCSACNDLCTVAGWANCIPEEQMYKSFKFCPNCGARMEG